MEDVTLNAQERHIVKVETLSWHETRWFVHALTVMPDHAHILATPLDESLRRHYSLSGILRSVKGRSSREVNRLRGRRGTLWQEGSPDRIVRDEREFHAKFEYILNNAVKEGLVTDGYEYDGFWCAGMPLPEGLRQHSSAVRPADLIPTGPLVKRRRRLPHWQLAGSTYFITFRLRPKVTTQSGRAETRWQPVGGGLMLFDQLMQQLRREGRPCCSVGQACPERSRGIFSLPRPRRGRPRATRWPPRGHRSLDASAASTATPETARLLH